MPDLAPLDPAWEPVVPYAELIGTRSFVSSDPTGDRIRVAYYTTGGTTWARAWFGPGAEGPPGHAHGGATAAVLDEAMGMAALLTGRVVVGRRIEVDYHALVPLGEVVTVEVAADAAAGRSVRVEATLRRSDGTVCCSAAGVFVDIGEARVREAAVAVGREIGAPRETP